MTSYPVPNPDASGERCRFGMRRGGTY